MSSADKIIEIARAEIGTKEGYASGHWNNIQKYSPAVPGLEWSNGQPWCATFVSWCAMKAGYADLYPRTASCDTAYAWFKARGQISEYPATGAQVFFGSPADLVHTGLVVGFDRDYIYTVEGNTNADGGREGYQVQRKARRRRDSYIVGYGYPKFPDGLLSADPNYKAPVTHGQPPKPSEAPKNASQPHVRDAIAAAEQIKGPKARSTRDKVLDLLKGLLK